MSSKSDNIKINYEDIYNNAPCGYFSSLPDGTIIDCNNTFLVLSGYERNEVVEKKNIRDFLTLGGRIYFETHYVPLLQMQGFVNEINFEWGKKDGSKLPVLLNSVRGIDTDGNPAFIQTTVFDISQRKQYERELLIAKKKVEELNNVKDKFFSIVAHDLKSPLNSLKAFSTLLIDHYDSLSKEEILAMSKQLKSSVDNTIKMADNLITWARIQMNDLDYSPELIQVKEIVANICEIYKDVANNKGINVSCSFGDSLSIFGDKNQIEFIIRNLVNNAVKFTDKGGFVSLEAKSLPDGVVEISVSDSGVGISDEMKAKLFSIEKKESKNGTAGEKGTGLGLMLSQEFAKLNKGTIEFKNRDDHGSIFLVKLKRG